MIKQFMPRIPENQRLTSDQLAVVAKYENRIKTLFPDAPVEYKVFKRRINGLHTEVRAEMRRSHSSGNLDLFERAVDQFNTDGTIFEPPNT